MAKKLVRCCKCGSTDICTAWHRESKVKFPRSTADDTCGAHRSCVDVFPRERKEHLHRLCRNCQYEWIDAIYEAIRGRKG